MSNKKGTMEIDGKTVEFSEGQYILDVALENGIYIPSLCYIKGMTPYGGCRLCLVKIDGVKGFPPSCGILAEEGMKVTANDEELKELRTEIMKLILSEHPYSCLLCDNNEHCEKLRPSAYKAGRSFGCHFCANKNVCEIRKIMKYLDIKEVPYDIVYKNHPLKRDDPFYEKDYNLCILCGRCIRVCNEVRGIGALNLINRGHDSKVATVFDIKSLDTNCQYCGACVDVCPTGALDSKNTKWNKDYTSVKQSICGFCSIGCGFNYYCIQGRLIETLPDKDNIVNKGQACLIGRFCATQFNNGKGRLKYPLIRKGNDLIPSTWEDAYKKIAKNFKKYNPNEIAVIVSQNLSNESAYLLNKFAKEIIKTEKITTRFYDDSINLFYKLVKDNLKLDILPRSLPDVENSKIIVLINANIQFSHPILLVDLIKAKNKGAKIVALNFSDVKLSLETKRVVDYDLHLSREEIITFLLKLNKAYIENINPKPQNIEKLDDFISWLGKTELPELKKEDENIIKEISHYIGLETTIILNLISRTTDTYLENLIGTVLNLNSLSTGKVNVIPLWERGNTEGVFQNIYYNTEKTQEEIIEEIKNREIKAVYLTERINKPQLYDYVEFIILQDIYDSDMVPNANVILPTCTYIEDSGSFINSELRLQKFSKSTHHTGNSKPDWKIISELAKYINDKDSKKFNYSNSQEIYLDMVKSNPVLKLVQEENLKSTSNNQILFKPDVGTQYNHPLKESLNLRYFNFRGEPVYNQVSDLDELINYREGQKPEPQEIKEKEVKSKSKFKVLLNQEIIPNFYKLIIEAPLLARKAKPGNFVILMREEVSERLPMTLTDWNTKEGTITIIYQEAGFSTRELTEIKEGDYLYSLVGPLGNAIPIANYGTVLLGGGCYGIGGILPIAKAMKAAGNYVIVILEARNKILFYLEDEYEKVADQIIYCTSDGSKGLKGKIDVGINHVINSGKKINRSHFIGCNYMMMTASNATKIEEPIPTYVNLNTIMIDGTGMCGCCRFTIYEDDKEITKFACVDGPAFNGHQIHWEELFNRGGQFERPETEIYQTHSCKAIDKLSLGEDNE
jgi:NADH dehydrogenase/NADH:ubiquinone oxidoreductase subunit G